jgi:hypothetical protein
MSMIVDLVAALAWPATVLVLGLLFRSELRGVIGRLTHVKYKDWEAQFDRELREAERRAKEIPEVHREPRLQLPESTEHERVLRLAQISPRAAVVEAWREVELATSRAARVAGLSVEGRIAGTRHFQKLVQQEVVAGSFVPLYEQLRRLRNEAAHAPEFEIDQAEAERYVDLALAIVLALDRVGVDAPPNQGLHPTAATNTSGRG